MTAKTPYRRLQERVQELEAISKVHQEQNGKLQMRIKELEKQIEDKRIDDGGWNSKENS
tara:strand:- start:734 stop:910 length:177 start_codon:yes stop_codon:yes gene_type:complete